MTQQPPPGQDLLAGGPLPTRGVFATSEILPMMARASAEMRARGAEWRELRETADRKRDEAKRIRANLIVRLRTWGNEVTGQPIKTSAERQEWANADADVQQAELEADLAQTVQMAAREAYSDAQGQFNVLQSMLAIERDENKAERGAPGGAQPQWHTG